MLDKFNRNKLLASGQINRPTPSGDTNKLTTRLLSKNSIKLAAFSVLVSVACLSLVNSE